jgi:hypothetical protein
MSATIGPRHISKFIPAALQIIGGHSGLRLYDELFGRQATGFDRRSLPSPLAYLTSKGLLRRKPRAEWVAIVCPQHKGGGESHPSLRVSLIDGHFRCMACGAKGGDIIALHRLLTGASFKDALRELGADYD